MKLSFSDKGWHKKALKEFCNIERELKFGGIELHKHNTASCLKIKDGAFHGYAAGGNRKAAL